MRHSLGLAGSDQAFRNHYASGPGCTDHQAILTLVKAGLMKEGEGLRGGLRYYHVTEAGRAAIGAPAALYQEDVIR